MMRLNHEFWCSVALPPGLRNWVEMTRNMQQEGVGLVLLPHPASLVRAPVLPCVEAPLGESGVLLADAGVRNPRVPLELMCCVCVCVCVCVGEALTNGTGVNDAVCGGDPPVQELVRLCTWVTTSSLRPVCAHCVPFIRPPHALHTSSIRPPCALHAPSLRTLISCTCNHSFPSCAHFRSASSKPLPAVCPTSQGSKCSCSVLLLSCWLRICIMVRNGNNPYPGPAALASEFTYGDATALRSLLSSSSCASHITRLFCACSIRFRPSKLSVANTSSSCK